MALTWARLDANIASHDKILSLIADPSSRRWQALSSYMMSIGWSVGQATDGLIPRHALRVVHGTEGTARLLVVYRLWEETLQGWRIVNFAERQQLDVVSGAKAESRRVAASKANCTRWHGSTCWKNGQCTQIRAV